MCGIVGYLGKGRSSRFILERLKRLEYRGYDSSGFANFTDGKIETTKAVGNISKLEERCDQERILNCAIAHTRWATHGVPSVENAHPHISSGGKWGVVHNGIIENYLEIKKVLQNKDLIASQTDTAVVSEFLEESNINDIYGFIESFKKIDGSYAIVAVNTSNPDTLFLARNKSPLFVAENNGEILVASDPICFCGFSKKYYQLENEEFALVNDGKIKFFNNMGKSVLKTEITLDDIFDDSTKGDYPHFMLKEIMEERSAINRIIKTYTEYDVFKSFDKTKFENIKRISFIGCGTAYHAGLMGARMVEKLTRIPANSIIASEFIYNDPLIDKNTLYIFVSQSGETADTLQAMELVKQSGCTTVALTNVLYSSLAKSTDFVFPVCAGPEIAVASTKAYVCQIAVCYCFARHIQNIKFNNSHDFISDLEKISKVILDLDYKMLEEIAEQLKDKSECIYIGKDLDNISAMEASLKLKEIGYIQANSYPSGELKHGFLALVEKGSFIFVLANQESINKKTYNSASEAVSRGARAVLVGNCVNKSEFEPEYHINLPKLDEILMPIVSIVPLQYLAYLVSVKKGINPDQPRNLAKSVTVE